MKQNKLRTQIGLAMLCICILLGGTPQRALCKKSTQIDAERLEQYTKIIHEYVTGTRHWKKEEYYIRFNYLDDEKHEADFTIVNIEDKKIFRSKIPPEKRRPNYQSCQWYPLEFYATIDTRQGKIVQELWLRKKEFLPLHPEFNIPEQ